MINWQTDGKTYALAAVALEALDEEIRADATIGDAGAGFRVLAQNEGETTTGSMAWISGSPNGTLTIRLDTDPTGPQETALDAVVAAHLGTPSPICGTYVSQRVLGGTLVGTVFVDLDEVVLQSAAYNSDPAQIFACLEVVYQTTTTTAEIQLVEDAGRNSGGVWVYDGAQDRVLDTVALPDTSGLLRAAHLQHMPPGVALTMQPEPVRFRLQARLGASGTAEVKTGRLDLIRRT